MRCYFKKVIISLGILGLLFSNVVYAHSGRTDSNGGHKDNQNKSGLGSYHYHCGGHPAHLHPNGICPYSSSSSSSIKNNSQSSNNDNNNNSNSSASTNNTSNSSSNTNTIIPEPTTINAESIEINENIEELNVGEIKQLTTNILPANTTDKKVTWKSSDESIVTVNEAGKILAQKAGYAEITASTSNGKTDSIEICVKEERKENNNIVIDTLSNKDNVNNTINNNNSENSSPMAGFISLGAIGGGGYWLYKKYKNKN